MDTGRTRRGLPLRRRQRVRVLGVAGRPDQGRVLPQRGRRLLGRRRPARSPATTARATSTTGASRGRSPRTAAACSTSPEATTRSPSTRSSTSAPAPVTRIWERHPGVLGGPDRRAPWLCQRHGGARAISPSTIPTPRRSSSSARPQGRSRRPSTAASSPTCSPTPRSPCSAPSPAPGQTTPTSTPTSSRGGGAPTAPCPTGRSNGLAVREWGVPRFWSQAARHDPNLVLARFDFAFDPHAASEVTRWIGGSDSDLLADDRRQRGGDRGRRGRPCTATPRPAPTTRSSSPTSSTTSR